MPIVWADAALFERPFRGAYPPHFSGAVYTGSIAVSAQRASDYFVVHPGQTWIFRYSVGDSLMLSVREADKSKTVQLDRAGRGTFNSPVKFKAEVNADGEEINFRFTDEK